MFASLSKQLSQLGYHLLFLVLSSASFSHLQEVDKHRLRKGGNSARSSKRVTGKGEHQKCNVPLGDTCWNYRL